jgi:hypothetical protein
MRRTHGGGVGLTLNGDDLDQDCGRCWELERACCEDHESPAERNEREVAQQAEVTS